MSVNNNAATYLSTGLELEVGLVATISIWSGRPNKANYTNVFIFYYELLG